MLGIDGRACAVISNESFFYNNFSSFNKIIPNYELITNMGHHKLCIASHGAPLVCIDGRAGAKFNSPLLICEYYILVCLV